MFDLPKLDYDYGALEPYIDEQTMKIHHSKHHQTYIDKLNLAIQEFPELEEKSIEDILENLDILPEKIKTTIQNNGGGHFNHALFWKSMSPNKNIQPSGKLSEAISSQFGDFSNFQAKFTEAAVGRFGSGWAWLVEANGKIKITSTANQDCPLSQKEVPILGLDVWEHAYYLKYQNRRPEYIEAWWSVVNWDEVGKRLD